MGNDKRHYDISMSRRTRRPFQVRDVKGMISPNSGGGGGGEGEENDRKSLKQLIDGDEKKVGHEGDEGGRGKSSLGEHLVMEGGEREGQEENKMQLQIVGVQNQNDGMNLKKMVSRYAKVLGHLIKKNKDSSKKKPTLMLKF
ncbi:hypothetical protein CsatB_021480 [Cannabis sativa]